MNAEEEVVVDRDLLVVAVFVPSLVQHSFDLKCSSINLTQQSVCNAT